MLKAVFLVCFRLGDEARLLNNDLLPPAPPQLDREDIESPDSDDVSESGDDDDDDTDVTGKGERQQGDGQENVRNLSAYKL